MADLREKVRDTLPVNVRTLMDEIEAFAGLPIRVALHDKPPSPRDPNPLAPGVAVSHEKATLLLRAPDVIDPQGVLHELLHVHRYWVEGVPQIMPRDGDESDDNWSVTSSVENAIEHLVIVPREADYGFERHEYWNRTEQEAWSQYPWPEMTHAFARRKSCLLGWLSSDLVTDPATKDLMCGSLAKEGMLEEAERFRKKMRLLIPNKARGLAHAVRTLNIPRNDVRLVYLDIKNKVRRYKKMPFVLG